MRINDTKNLFYKRVPLNKIKSFMFVQVCYFIWIFYLVCFIYWINIILFILFLNTRIFVLRHIFRT